MPDFAELIKKLNQKYQAQNNWHTKKHNEEDDNDNNGQGGGNGGNIGDDNSIIYVGDNGDDNDSIISAEYNENNGGNIDEVKEKKKVIPEKESCEDPNQEKNNDNNDNDGQGGGNGGNDSIKEGRQLLKDEYGKYYVNEIDKMIEKSNEMNREDIEEVQEEEVSSRIIKIVIDVEQVNFLMKNESEKNVGAFFYIGAEKGNAAIVIGGIGSNKELPEDYGLINEGISNDVNYEIF